MLYLANGRMGDALLAAPWTARYRAWFGRVVAVGRPETQPIVAPLVDHFVAFDPGADPRAATGRPALAAARAAARGCRLVLGDLHLSHQGDALLALAAAVGGRCFVYDGWIDRSMQAPFRRWPAHADVVPSLPKAPRAHPADDLHVTRDLAHYHRQVLAALGLPDESPAVALPPHLADASQVRALGLAAGGYVACHAQTSQPKKDWPLAHFDALFAACPDQRFAVLGTGGPALPPRANVVDLRGRTNVGAAIAVAAAARAFVGLDSGLAHAAALARVPTVVVMPAATTGYFFPYPADLGMPVTAVASAAHAACAGCGGICALEPLWRSRRRGFPCLRAVDVAEVAAALRRSLGASARTQ